MEDLWFETKKSFNEINGFLNLQLGLSFELGLRLRLTNSQETAKLYRHIYNIKKVCPYDENVKPIDGIECEDGYNTNTKIILVKEDFLATEIIDFDNENETF